MKNIVIFASDAKGLSSLNSIINEAAEQGINIFAMVSHDTVLRYPTINKDRFEILTNVENTNPTYSKTLNTTIPFKPDWLIVCRERWEPETSIILEFKQEYNCKVGVVEINSQLFNGAETVLETVSKNRFNNLIDVYFDHSEFIVNQRKIVGFLGNSIIVGNPKYDTNLNVDNETINQIKKLYKVDDNKKQVLLFSLINSSRNRLFTELEKYVKNNPDYQYYIKPYPSEPFDSKFKNDYYPKFKIDNVTPILEDAHIWSMFNICDIHIGALGSIFHASYLLNKTIVNIAKDIDLDKTFLKKDHILNSSGEGIESSKELWQRSLNINDSQLNDLLSDNIFKIIKNNNEKVWNNEDDLLSLFDDYNDFKASKRIIEYIKNEN